MKRPSFQFYPADWRNNANLCRCSMAARGAWISVLCVLHDSEEYGLVRWPLAELSNAANAPMKLIRELVDKKVLKGSDKAFDDPLVYVPRSGRKNGAPVTLVARQDGPVWFSSRMVRDEYVRGHAGAGTRFGQKANDHPPEPFRSPGASPSQREGDAKGAPRGAPSRRESDGSSSSSSTSLREREGAHAGHGESDHPAVELVELVNGIRPEWRAAPVLNPAEERALKENTPALAAFALETWDAMRDYMAVRLPEGAGGWQPDQRLTFIRTAGDVASRAADWHAKRGGRKALVGPALPSDVPETFVTWAKARYSTTPAALLWSTPAIRKEWDTEVQGSP